MNHGCTLQATVRMSSVAGYYDGLLASNSLHADEYLQYFSIETYFKGSAGLPFSRM